MQWPAPRGAFRIALWTFVSFVISYLSEMLAMEFTLPNTYVAIVWPASGLAVAIAILVSPWTAFGALAADAIYQYPSLGSAQFALLSGLALGLQVFVISSVVRRFLGGTDALLTPSGVVKYAIFAAGLGTTISATIGLSAFVFAGLIPVGDVPVSWVTWWVSDIVSLLLITPFVLKWARPAQARLGTRREAWVIAAVTVAIVIAFVAAPIKNSTFALAILALPLVAWTAFRLGSRAVVSVTLALAVAAFAQLVVPWRPVAPDIAILLETQVFIAIVSATGLSVAAYVRRETLRMQQAALDEFAAVDAARNRLLSTFAHELNNPLTPIMLELELLRDKSGDPLSAGQVKALAVVERNALRLSKLVRDLRDVGLLQAEGGLRIRSQVVDVTQLAHEVAESYRGIANAAQIHLDVRNEGPIEVHADPDRLAQVLSNLLDNAIKYSPAGAQIVVDIRSRRDEASIAVRDAGPGMSAEQIARLFRPFEQVQPEARQKNGTGLGLYVARGIIEAHHGRIRCESEGQGRGSTFVVEIPRTMPFIMGRGLATPHEGRPT